MNEAWESVTRRFVTPSGQNDIESLAASRRIKIVHTCWHDEDGEEMWRACCKALQCANWIQLAPTGDPWWRLPHGPARHWDTSWRCERLHSHECRGSRSRNQSDISIHLMNSHYIIWYYMILYMYLYWIWPRCRGGNPPARSILSHLFFSGLLCLLCGLKSTGEECTCTPSKEANTDKHSKRQIGKSHPSQVISITDGQIFLETELFYKALD